MPGKTNSIIAGSLIIVAVLYLLISSTGDAAHYYLTIEEARQLDAAGQQRDLTVSGAVMGESIVYDELGATLTFTIIQIPSDPREVERAEDLEQVIRAALRDPTAPTLEVVYHGSRPDMLRHEAQAILYGRMSEDGRFHADELRLKCPSRYEEALPEQATE
ncbi:MAG: cytochrome c maturation protein CcmE [Anaerolineales bacterium]